MIGKRCLEIFLLCGPILSVWSHIQDIIHRYDKNASIQVVRLKTTKGKRLVGKQRLKSDRVYISIRSANTQQLCRGAGRGPGKAGPESTAENPAPAKEDTERWSSITAR